MHGIEELVEIDEPQSQEGSITLKDVVSQTQGVAANATTPAAASAEVPAAAQQPTSPPGSVESTQKSAASAEAAHDDGSCDTDVEEVSPKTELTIAQLAELR